MCTPFYEHLKSVNQDCFDIGTITLLLLLVPVTAEIEPLMKSELRKVVLRLIFVPIFECMECDEKNFSPEIDIVISRCCAGIILLVQLLFREQSQCESDVEDLDSCFLQTCYMRCLEIVFAPSHAELIFESQVREKRLSPKEASWGEQFLFESGTMRLRDQMVLLMKISAFSACRHIWEAYCTSDDTWSAIEVWNEELAYFIDSSFLFRCKSESCSTINDIRCNRRSNGGNMLKKRNEFKPSMHHCSLVSSWWIQNYSEVVSDVFNTEKIVANSKKIGIHAFTKWETSALLHLLVSLYSELCSDD